LIAAAIATALPRPAFGPTIAIAIAVDVVVTVTVAFVLATAANLLITATSVVQVLGLLYL